MTWAEREAIFSKDVMTLDEFMHLMNMDKSTASSTMCEIKRCLSKPRVSTAGKLHVQDYIDYYGLDIRRYMRVTAVENSIATISKSNTDSEPLNQIERIRSMCGGR